MMAYDYYYWNRPLPSRYDATYNSTTMWRRWTSNNPSEYDTADRNPPLDWLDGENYPLNTQYIIDLYNATRNLVGYYYKYDESFTPLYFTDFTIEELPPTEEPDEALQSILETLKKLEWIRLRGLRRGYLGYDGYNWHWYWGSVYTSGALSGFSSGYPWYGSVRYQGSYTPAFIPLLVPENLQSDLTIIFHFDYSEWCNSEDECDPMGYSFSKNVSVEQSGIAPDGSGGCPQSTPQDIPVDIKMDVHQGYSVEESPDDVHGENIWEHNLTNASEDWSSSVDCIRWGGIAGRRSWYGYNGDEWTGSWTWYGWTSRWKYFYNRVDIGDVDSDTWLTLYQEPLILRRSYPQDIQPTETNAGRWYSASTNSSLILDRITAHVEFQYPGEISFVTEREEWCGDGCTYPMLVIGSSANLSNGNMYDSVEIGSLTLSYNSLIDYRGPLGNNWTHNYNIHLSSISGTITLLDEDGTSVKFTDYNNDGIYESDARFGEYSTIIKNNDNTYTLTSKYDMIYSFNQDGKLTRIEDRNGNTQTFTYTDSNLTGVTDSVGRVTSLTYNIASQITNITDQAERTTELNYDLEGNLTQIKNPDGNSWNYTYDSQNRLISKQDPKGSIYAYTYDEEGRLISAIDPDNNTINIQYIPENNQTIFTDPLGNQTIYTYDKALNVWTSIRDPLGNTISKTWDINRNNLASQDALGNTTTNTYDERGNLLTTQDAQGNSTTYTYEAVYNQVLRETNPLGNATVYEYDTRGNRTKTIDLLGGIIEYTYTPDGNLLTTKDQRGNITTNTYDEYGSLSSTIDAQGNTTVYTYDITGNITSSQDPAGHTTTYTYNNLNQLIATRDPQGNTTEYTYDANGNRTSVKDAQGNITQYQYDSQNRLIKTQDPQGNTTEYYYDTNDNQTGVKDPGGNITTNVYDSAGRLIQVTDSQGHTTSYAYDPSGNRTSITDTNGNTTTYTYNNLTQLISTTDPQGNVTAYTYDVTGNRTSIKDPQGNTWHYTYDSLNRLITETDPQGNITHYTYDANGNKTSITDPLGRITRYTYNSLNQITTVTDPLNGQTSFTYDARGNRTSVTDANGHTRRFVYNSLNQLIQEIDHLTNTIIYTYDSRGNLIGKTTPNGNTINYTYDSLNRLITKGTVPISGTVPAEEMNYTYDKLGDLIRQENSRTTIENSYDTKNRLISQTITQHWQDGSQTTRTIRYEYDTLGNRTQTTDPENGITTYTYDPLTKNLTSITNPDGKVTNYTYDNLNRRTRIDYPNNTHAEYAYDTLSRIILLTNYDSSGKIISSYSYTYDKAGNRINMTTIDKTIDYTYDNLNRLTFTNVQGLLPLQDWWISYTYDSVGNRLSMDIDSTKPALPWRNEYSPTLDQVPYINKPIHVTYTHNEADQLVYEFGQEKLKGYGSPFEIFYDYDPDGNMTEKTLYKGWSITGAPESGKVTTYAYDAEDRLTQILFPNNQTNTFYDCFCGAKQMEYTDASGEITRYFLDGDQVLYEYDGNNQIKSRYTNGAGIDEKISMTRYNSNDTHATYYYHYDALGSVTAMTDEKGKLVETYDYDPFGAIIDHDRNVTKNLYTYTGRNYIPDAGIYYYRNRYYDPRVGRFGQVDPILHQPSTTAQTLQSFTRPTSCQTCRTSSQNIIQTIPISGVNQNLSTILEHSYAYVKNNPIRYTDPNGEKIIIGYSIIPGLPINAWHTFIIIEWINGNRESWGFTFAPGGNFINSEGYIEYGRGPTEQYTVESCYDYDARVQLAIWWWYDLWKLPRYGFNVPVSIACTQEGPCNCYSWRNAILQQAGLGPVDDNAFWHPAD